MGFAQEPTEKAKDSGPLLTLLHPSFSLSTEADDDHHPEDGEGQTHVGTTHLKKSLLYPRASGKPTGRIYY
jgi:hypothetical protein